MDIAAFVGAFAGSILAIFVLGVFTTTKEEKK
jgi:hypothetical protein